MPTQGGQPISHPSSHDAVRRVLGRVLPPAMVLALALVGWELYVRLAGVSPSVLPAPTRIVRAGLDDRSQLGRDAWATLLETLGGLGLAILAAGAIGLLVDRFVLVERGLLPLLVASQTLPVIVLAPLMVAWFGFGTLPRLLVVALFTFFPICVGLIRGLAGADAAAVDLVRTMGAGRGAALRYVRLPGALPSVFTGLRLSVTYAVAAAVTAEWLGGFDGLGIYMVRARNSFATDLIFAAVLMTVILTLLLFAIVAGIERLLRRGRSAHA